MVPELFYLIAFFVFGTIVGSFLNVCIVRWPHEKSVVSPPSHCPKCLKNIQWYDNVPILSYFLLGGKCRSCGEKFSIRYAFVEFLTGCVFLGFYLLLGLNIYLLPYLFMMCCFIIATFVDFEHRIIPDEVSLGGMWIGFVLSALLPKLHPSVHMGELTVGLWMSTGVVVISFLSNIMHNLFHKTEQDEANADVVFMRVCVLLLLLQYGMVFWGGQGGAYSSHALALASSIQGALIGGGFIYLMGVIGEWVFRKEAMGGGDVKLLAMIGAFLGWKLALLTFFVAPFFGAFVGIIEKIRTKDSTIAYGPYLVLGAIISMFWGDLIILWIMNGYRLP